MKHENNTKQQRVNQPRARVAALKRSKRKDEQAVMEYKTIIGTAMDGFGVTDIQGRFLDVNDAYSTLTGYSREELLKMHIQDVEAAERPEETARHIRQVIAIGADRFETRHRVKMARSWTLRSVSITLPAMVDDLSYFCETSASASERRRHCSNHTTSWKSALRNKPQS